MLARPNLRPDKRARKEALLEGPGVPEPLEYLHDWFRELWAMREIGQRTEVTPDGHGMMVVPQSLPFTPQFIQGWAELMDRDPTPSEVHALVHLSHVAIRPPPPPDTPDREGG